METNATPLVKSAKGEARTPKSAKNCSARHPSAGRRVDVSRVHDFLSSWNCRWPQSVLRVILKRDGINWITVIAFTVLHAGAIAALFFFTWPAFFTALALYWISLSLASEWDITGC